MLGAYLKKYRMNHNYSQKEMANKLETSQGYYSLLETGVKQPGIQMIDRIAKLLEMEPGFVRGLL